MTSETLTTRQLVLATRRQGLRGLLGRANGGMVVHLGIVIIAVAFAASHSFSHRGEFTLAPGQSQRVACHTVTYLGTEQVQHRNRLSIEARVRVDGGRVFRPAVSQYPFASEAIGTPSVDSTWRNDVYLTLASAPKLPTDPAVIGVLVQPLVAWLWFGGGVVFLGTLLAAWPGRRRRPTSPVSAALPGTTPASGNGHGDDVEHDPTLVGSAGRGRATNRRVIGRLVRLVGGAP